MRLYGAVGLLPRYTESGATVGDVEIPPDSWVLFGVRSANRDEAQYPDAERLCGSCAARAAPGHLRRHAALFCLGVHLAKAELALSLELLLARLPGLRLAAGPMPQSQAVLRGVRRLPVAFDALPGRPSAEECVARIAARLERFEVGGFIDVAGQAFTSHDRGGECHA